jgi:lipoprotein NlpI
MHFSKLLLVVASLLSFASPVSISRAADDDDICASEKVSGDETIAACSRFLNSIRTRKKIYVGSIESALANRAEAYMKKGDVGSAIHDYDVLIKINPKDVFVWFSRGNAYAAIGNYEQAIADYNQQMVVIPDDGMVYIPRGGAYAAAGKSDLALADYNQAIKHDGKNLRGYVGRGGIYLANGDYVRALADYNQAIRLNSNYELAYSGRALSHLYSGDLINALTDINHAHEIDPKYAYSVIWLDIIAHRAGVGSNLARAAAGVDMTVWPGPVLKLFLEQTTVSEVFTAAGSPNAGVTKNQLCEANFYTGELALQKGSKDEAIRLFRLAVGGCQHDYPEWAAAKAELKTFGIQN